MARQRHLGILAGLLLSAIPGVAIAATPTTPAQTPAQPASAPTATPTPQTRDLTRTVSRCYVRQADQSYTAYECEIRTIYNTPGPKADAVQIKWSYGATSDFLWTKARGWQWFDPGSRQWLPYQPEWLQTSDFSCLRFGNMCFGRGFPIQGGEKLPEDNPAKATTAAAPTTAPSPTPTAASAPPADGKPAPKPSKSP
jgi:hypothetical protein